MINLVCNPYWNVLKCLAFFFFIFYNWYKYICFLRYFYFQYFMPGKPENRSQTTKNMIGHHKLWLLIVLVYKFFFSTLIVTRVNMFKVTMLEILCLQIPFNQITSFNCRRIYIFQETLTWLKKSIYMYFTF